MGNWIWQWSTTAILLLNLQQVTSKSIFPFQVSYWFHLGDISIQGKDDIYTVPKNPKH